MPNHHFTTPKVTYLGAAHAEKQPAREPRSASRAHASRTRPAQDRVAQRRAPIGSPDTVR